MQLAVLILFPNLQLFYPIDLSRLDKDLYYDETPSVDCKRELNIANECIINATNKFLPSNYATLSVHQFFSIAPVLDYNREIVDGQCLKHSKCQNVVFMRQIYESLTPVIETAFGSAKDCLEKSETEIIHNIENCKFEKSMLDCANRMIGGLSCNVAEKEALTRALIKSVEINERLNEPVKLLPEEYDNGKCLHHALSLVMFVAILWF